MYQVLPSYTLGFHGCDQSVAKAVLAGKSHLKRSRNIYDWLGEGVYFWENSRRPLDCAVINAMHQTRIDKALRPFDTVRAAFAEGGDLYPGSGIAAKHHIQIAVRTRRSIKGYFRPLRVVDLPVD